MYDYERKASSKVGMLDNGPVGRALSKHWNELHDMEYALEQSIRDYDDAAHFSGGPAQHEAQEMIKKIQAAHKELEHVSMHTLNTLAESEAAFVKKHGEPGDYADEMRKKTFPRSAAAPQTKADFTKLQHQMSADLDTFELAWSRYEKDPVANKHKLDDALKYMKDLHALAAVLIKNMEQLKAG